MDIINTKLNKQTTLLYRYINETCAIGPSVSPLQNRENQHVNIVLECIYLFFEQPNMKGNNAWIEW